ncbi:hypothetical protein FIBSPDRAFT_1048692 [Athelia psychrophila]|uniref:Uncharacterized protein n=1 Tax=Athelia psychrophila TaxID=1759441 RepID=A0A166DCZ5_9AGAM|nr:hypothetical protein FIBSPDRAFT_1048690 [Fibularhizoctonia sp. CBS 109695]KZP14575.1 hypothetical protein FIBSPDRAFT_1048692 [Fibularhizoctonia sp. CBS 109695]
MVRVRGSVCAGTPPRLWETSREHGAMDDDGRARTEAGYSWDESSTEFVDIAAAIGQGRRRPPGLDGDACTSPSHSVRKNKNESLSSLLFPMAEVCTHAGITMVTMGQWHQSI